MKHLISFNEVPENGRESYVEFQLPTAVKEFWDEDSLYIESKKLKESGLDNYFCECALKDIIFDGDTISSLELNVMFAEAENRGGVLFEVLKELYEWAMPKLDDEKKRVAICRYFVNGDSMYNEGI